MELYPSLKPLKVERPATDRRKAWHPPGCVPQAAYERKQFQQAFTRKERPRS